jgi:hypothetical protein
MSELCHCGKPLHYSDPIAQAHVEALIQALGPNIRVTAGMRTWLVPRHYIALHGLKAEDVPSLGFQEVTHERN